jgi:hypothetical protein
MQCSLCELVYSMVDEWGMCDGCAEDMAEAERIVQTLKSTQKSIPATRRAYFGAAARNDDDPLPPANYELAPALRFDSALVGSANPE